MYKLIISVTPKDERIVILFNVLHGILRLNSRNINKFIV